MGNFFYSHYVARYKRKTTHLTMLQDGAYRRLLDSYYESGKPLPEDNEQIIRISGAHSEEEIKAVSVVLKQFFSLKNGAWHNRTADEELHRMRQLSKLRSNSAKRRWDDKRNANASANASAQDVQSECDLKTLRLNNESKPQRERGSRLPEDWIPKESHYQLAKECGVILDMELPQFRDHFLGNTGPGMLKLDWDRAFNNWLRRSKRFGGGNGTNRGVTQVRQPSAAVARWHNNRGERERARAAVVGQAGTAGNGQTAGLGAGNAILLDGEVTKI